MVMGMVVIKFPERQRSRFFSVRLWTDKSEIFSIKNKDLLVDNLHIN